MCRDTRGRARACRAQRSAPERAPPLRQGAVGVDLRGCFCALRPDSPERSPERNLGAFAEFKLGAPALGLLSGAPRLPRQRKPCWASAWQPGRGGRVLMRQGASKEARVCCLCGLAPQRSWQQSSARCCRLSWFACALRRDQRIASAGRGAQLGGERGGSVREQT